MPAKLTTKKTTSKTTQKSVRPIKKPAAKKYRLKTKPTSANVKSFIDNIANEARRNDARTLLTLMKQLTGEPARMWGPSIIGFGSYHYKYSSGHEGDMCMIGFSPRVTALVLYIIPGFLRYKSLLASLGKYKHGKSCLYFNKLADVDMTVLKQLIVESFTYMRTKYR